jgi:propanediol dehydratase small subunit
MKSIITITILLVIVLAVMAAAIPNERESKRRLQRYWDRVCTGAKWRRRFPNIPKEEIRRFLEAFIDGFAFKSNQRLKFAPDDKVMDIYRALYPTKDWPDALELETFANNLHRTYGFDLSQVHDENATLGQIFEMIRK